MRSGKLALPLTGCSTWKSSSTQYSSLLSEHHTTAVQSLVVGGGQPHDGQDQFTCSPDPKASSSNFHMW